MGYTTSKHSRVWHACLLLVLSLSPAVAQDPGKQQFSWADPVIPRDVRPAPNETGSRFLSETGRPGAEQQVLAPAQAKPLDAAIDQAADPNSTANGESKAAVAGSMAANQPAPAAIDVTGAQAGYRVNPGDRIRVKFFQRDELSGEYDVRSDGTISFPLLGAVNVAGRNLAEIETAIRESFQRVTQRTAYVSVQTVSARPVFVVGDVNRPGAVAYTQGLMPLQAVALSGGLYRTAQTAASATELYRDQWRRLGISEDLARTEIKLARLEAERERRDTIPPNPRLTHLIAPERVATLMSQESVVLRQNRSWIESEENRRKQVIERIKLELAELSRRLSLIDQEEGVHVSELNDTEDLLQRGLTTRTRVYTKKYSLSSLRQSASSVRAEIARAEKSLTEAEEGMRALWQNRQRELTDQIRSAQDDSTRQQQSLSAANGMMHINGGAAYAQLVSSKEQPAPQTRYELTRWDDKAGVHQILDVAETAVLKPGDVLRVVAAPLAAIPASMNFTPNFPKDMAPGGSMASATATTPSSVEANERSATTASITVSPPVQNALASTFSSEAAAVPQMAVAAIPPTQSPAQGGFGEIGQSIDALKAIVGRYGEQFGQLKRKIDEMSDTNTKLTNELSGLRDRLERAEKPKTADTQNKNMQQRKMRRGADASKVLHRKNRKSAEAKSRSKSQKTRLAARNGVAKS